MSSTLPKTGNRARPKLVSRIKLMSRCQTYYRDANPPIEEIDGQGEIVRLVSRGVAYRKQFIHRIYQKPNADAINWRWRMV